LALNLNAQEFFSATGVETNAANHVKFMKQHKAESDKRAAMWQVPALSVQIIASVQSEAGRLEGYNYGAVLPAPQITKYPKFAKLDDFGLVACNRASRGLESIALALRSMNDNYGGSLQSNEDFLKTVFGSGGELSIMASEAEKAYQAYTGDAISLRSSYSTAPTPSYTPPTNTTYTETPNMMVESVPTKTMGTTESKEEVVESYEVVKTIEQIAPAQDVREEVVETFKRIENTEVIQSGGKSMEVTEVEIQNETAPAKMTITETSEEMESMEVAPRNAIKTSTQSDITMPTEQEDMEEDFDPTSTSTPQSDEKAIARPETYEETGVTRKVAQKEVVVEDLEGAADEEEMVLTPAEIEAQKIKEAQLAKTAKKQEVLKTEAQKEVARRAEEMNMAEEIIMKQRAAAAERKKKEEEAAAGGESGGGQ